MKRRVSVWLGLLGGVAAAEIFTAVVLYDIGSGIARLPEPVGIFSLCISLFGLSGPTFYSELQAANARMHQNMDIATSGNPDRDFAQMMLAHHQGAIDMSLVQLKYGNDKPLRRLAQSIIVEQEQEITYMRSLIGQQSAALFVSKSNTGKSEHANE